MSVFDPSAVSLKQSLYRIANSFLGVGCLLVLTYWVQNYHLLLLIDGAILSNILMLMLPNALYLYQVNYGYLKFQESSFNYLLATFLFYLSAFNITYTFFRAVQSALGALNVRNIA